MKSNASRILSTKQNEVLELWMKQQLKDVGLREDLMSSNDLKKESEELLNALLGVIKKDNFDDTNSKEYDKISEVLAGISLSRVKNGFSPRETAYFVFSLKDALISVLEKSINDPKVLITEVLNISRLIDGLGLITVETFIKGSERVFNHIWFSRSTAKAHFDTGLSRMEKRRFKRARI